MYQTVLFGLLVFCIFGLLVIFSVFSFRSSGPARVRFGHLFSVNSTILHKTYTTANCIGIRMHARPVVDYKPVFIDDQTRDLSLDCLDITGQIIRRRVMHFETGFSKSYRINQFTELFLMQKL